MLSLINPLIHFVSAYLGLSHSGSSLTREAQISLSPDTFIQFSESFPGQPRGNLSNVSLVIPKDLSQLCMTQTPHQEASKRYCNSAPMPPHLAPLNAERQQLHDYACHPVSKGEPGHPAKEIHFSRMYDFPPNNSLPGLTLNAHREDLHPPAEWGRLAGEKQEGADTSTGNHDQTLTPAI